MWREGATASHVSGRPNRRPARRPPGRVHRAGRRPARAHRCRPDPRHDDRRRDRALRRLRGRDVIALVGFVEPGDAAARATVARRAPFAPEPAVGPELTGHLAELAAGEPAASLMPGGWRPRSVDLTQVIATKA